jgi:hypothetical protein
MEREAKREGPDLSSADTMRVKPQPTKLVNCERAWEEFQALNRALPPPNPVDLVHMRWAPDPGDRPGTISKVWSLVSREPITVCASVVYVKSVNFWTRLCRRITGRRPRETRRMYVRALERAAHTHSIRWELEGESLDSHAFGGYRSNPSSSVERIGWPVLRCGEVKEGSGGRRTAVSSGSAISRTATSSTS